MKYFIVGGIIAVIIVGVVVFAGNTKNTGGNAQTVPITESGKTYTLADVSTHAVEGNCWTVVRGKVFDISTFTSKHSGGPGILKGCGIDSTQIFEKRPNGTPHPEKSWGVLQTYLIGSLK